ncbi:hypothetical protein R6Q57_009223 [Mikania cordata]
MEEHFHYCSSFDNSCPDLPYSNTTSSQNPDFYFHGNSRECLQFGDKASDPTELEDKLVEATLLRIGNEVLYPPTVKKSTHHYWRYLAHVVFHCLSGRKGGYDVLNETLSSCNVAITLGVDFKYSRMVFRDMYVNIKAKRKERFMAFPRFIQIIINKRHQNLVPTVGMLV